MTWQPQICAPKAPLLKRLFSTYKPFTKHNSLEMQTRCFAGVSPLWADLSPQVKETSLETFSGKRLLWLRPVPTSALWPTVTSMSLNVTLCRRCWSSTRRFPTTSQETCCSLTTCEKGWVTLHTETERDAHTVHPLASTAAAHVRIYFQLQC